MFEVTDAAREQLIGSIALIGPSGAGKTLSLLKIAKGMMDQKYGDSISDAEKWQKIGVIDTEHKRAKIYANTTKFGLHIQSFKHLDFQAPFTVSRLDQAVKFLKDKHKVEIVITDSISHFWDGEGGMLDLQQTHGGNFQAWRKVNPDYNTFISLVTGDKHNIDTLNGIRSKQEYQVSQNETGKLTVEKLGLKPTQRDSLEYEFQIVFSIDMDHIATVSKDNSGIFEGRPQVIEPEVGEQIYAWLKEGEDVFAKEQEEKEKLINEIANYGKHDIEAVAEYTISMVNRTTKRYGELDNLPLDRLNGFLDILKAKEIEINKAIAEAALREETIKEEQAKNQKEAEYGDQEALKALRDVARTFKIKGFTTMSKEELETEIKKAQAKQSKGA